MAIKGEETFVAIDSRPAIHTEPERRSGEDQQQG
jgi:hypothetical protein